MSWTDRDPASLSTTEISEILTREFCGLPPPAEGAPAEEYHRYAVAGFFLLFCHEAASPTEGKIAATNFLLQQENDRADFLPHIESALGRELTDAERREARISAI